MKSILIVDDEEKIRDVIASYLHSEGFQTKEAANGKQAVEMILHFPIDLIILDLMLPDLSGEEVCQQVHQISPVPILMLTAKAAEEDRITGLAIGADDYVVKPFSPREVVARVKVILRRSGNDLLADRISFQNGDLIIDAVKRKVFKKEKDANLTPVEYKLLLVLARHPGRSFAREELIEKVFGYDYPGEMRTIDQHIKNLRHKIEADPSCPVYILTVYGFGYRFGGDRR
ncbi:response regulator transcription factor [Thermoactinomyces mirandus]|uniref:Response regulator transcription factor n=1 Tax=Thermoactinomyces mirandus TaxID=2756294 RepID=A0A7W1XU54_9BACL|nr:response regulator transcription factor [Thermoactinomyces mirandus]MBA4603309.1 response regulator transcription factor [Thermoactinomyces mirandus]